MPVLDIELPEELWQRLCEEARRRAIAPAALLREVAAGIADGSLRLVHGDDEPLVSQQSLGIPSYVRDAWSRRNTATFERAHARVSRLTARFGDYLGYFERNRPFSPAQVEAHCRTLGIRAGHCSAHDALMDCEFARSLWDTLDEWNMNARRAQLLPLNDFADGLREQAEQIRKFEGLKIERLSSGKVEETAGDLWRIIAGLRIAQQNFKLVVCSKALHHILPDLVPPVDREYTLRFFYNQRALSGTVPEERAFHELYVWFHYISCKCAPEIHSRLRPIREEQSHMNTSVTRVIDNAVVGFVKKHPEEFSRPRE